MHLHLVHGRSHGVMGGGGIEEADALAAVAEEYAVGIRIGRQLLDAQQLISDKNVIVDGQLVPGINADAGAGRIVIAEGDKGLGQGAQGGPLHRLVFGIENLDDGIERRAKPAGIDFENQALALFGLKTPEIDPTGISQDAVACSRNRNGAGNFPRR